MKTRVVHVNDNVPGAVYIGRANGRRGLKGNLLANPYTIGRHGDRQQVIGLYRADVGFKCRVAPMYFNALRELVGKPLACWCRHDGEERTEANACHGDVLIELIDALGLGDGT